MKSSKILIAFVLCIPVILFVCSLTAQHALAGAAPVNDGPVVKIEVSCKYVNLYTLSSDSNVNQQRKVFPKGSVLTISGEDEASEPKAIYVTVNQTQEELYKEPLKLNAKGRHTVKIRAIGKDNNETTLSITYLIVE